MTGSAARKMPEPQRGREALRDRIIEMSHSQSRLLEQSAGTAQSLDDQATRSMELARQTAKYATGAREVAERGKTTVDTLSSSMERLAEVRSELDAIAEFVGVVGKKSEAIYKIAFQSRLLAINVAIEAARAGSRGKAFAAVAQSVHDLASRSADAATEIQELVAVGAKSVRRVIDHTKERIDDTKRSTGDASNAFEEIYAQVDSIAEHVQQILETGEAQHEQAKAFAERLKSGSEDQAAKVSEMIGLVTGVKIEDLTPRQVANSRGLVIIDVRRPDEFGDELGHIRDASLISLGPDFEERISHLPRTRAYLFVCRRGGRSARAARIAQMAGFPRIFNLAGGMMQWRDEGLPSVGRHTTSA